MQWAETCAQSLFNFRCAAVCVVAVFWTMSANNVPLIPTRGVVLSFWSNPRAGLDFECSVAARTVHLVCTCLLMYSHVVVFSR